MRKYGLFRSVAEERFRLEFVIDGAIVVVRVQLAQAVIAVRDRLHPVLVMQQRWLRQRKVGGPRVGGDWRGAAQHRV